MLLLSFVVMSLVAFADGESCPVKDSRGADGAVYLSHNNAQSAKNGDVTVTLYFKGDRGNNADTNICSKCNGTGRVSCKICKGDGRTTCGGCSGKGKDFVVGKGWVKCSICGGKGALRCYHCGGSGSFHCFDCNGRGKK